MDSTAKGETQADATALEKRLSEEQKKRHHIESEQKRRQAIRQAFERLVELVPALGPADSRSEIVVLQQTAAYLRQLGEENDELRQQLQPEAP